MELPNTGGAHKVVIKYKKRLDLVCSGHTEEQKVVCPLRPSARIKVPVHKDISDKHFHTAQAPGLLLGKYMHTTGSSP